MKNYNHYMYFCYKDLLSDRIEYGMVNGYFCFRYFKKDAQWYKLTNKKYIEFLGKYIIRVVK